MHVSNPKVHVTCLRRINSFLCLKPNVSVNSNLKPRLALYEKTNTLLHVPADFPNDL